jgi:hypothetical protein
LRQIDGAIQQWALDRQATTNSLVTWNDSVLILPGGSRPRCPDVRKAELTRLVASRIYHNVR